MRNIGKRFLAPKIDLGTIKSNNKYISEFHYRGIHKILKWELSCDCLSVHDDILNKKLVVSWKAKKIPKHLIARKQDYYKTVKTISVYFAPTEAPDDKQMGVLTITAIVKDVL